MKKRLYVGKVSYLPVDEEQTQTTQDSTSSEQATGNGGSSNWQVGTGDDLCGQQNVQTVELDDTAQENGDKIDLSNDSDIHDPKEAPKDAEPTSSEAVSSGQSQDSPLPTSTTNEQATLTAEAFTDTNLSTITKTQSQIMTKSKYGPSTDLLPSLSDPVPSNWKTIENEFLSVSVLMIPHMSNNFFGDPKMSIGTEKLRLVFVEHAMSRMNMVAMLMDADSGKHISMDNILTVDCKAYRLEPETPVGLLTVDGESVPYGVVQSQIHPGLARVMCRKRRT